jgi:hypothetical protein
MGAQSFQGVIKSCSKDLYASLLNSVFSTKDWLTSYFDQQPSVKHSLFLKSTSKRAWEKDQFSKNP